MALELEKNIEQALGKLTLKKTTFTPHPKLEQQWKVAHPKTEASPQSHPLYCLIGQMYEKHLTEGKVVSHPTRNTPSDRSTQSSATSKTIKEAAKTTTDSFGGFGDDFENLPDTLSCFSSDFYLYDSGKSNLLEVVWSLAFPDCIHWTEKSRTAFWKEIRMQMSMELSDYYERYQYRLKGFRRSKMQENLLTTDPLHPECVVYLSNFLDLNFFIIKPPEFYTPHPVDLDRASIVIYDSSQKYYGILHPQKDQQFFETKKLIETLQQNFTSVALSKTVQGEAYLKELPTLPALRKMKVVELRDLSIKMELPVKDDKGKLVLKGDLLKTLVELVQQTKK